MVKYLRRPYHIPDYEIVSDCPKFLESLYLQYGGYISDAECENPYRITVTKEIADPLVMLDDILFNTTTYDTGIIPLHGAAVEYKGNAYIFLAPTTSGKTTLTAYLVCNGFGYITEDTVLLDKKSFRIYPYLCPIHLRKGGIDVLQNHGITIPALKPLDSYNNIRYVSTPDNCVKTSTPFGKIFFITRSETENHVINMNVSESIIELMKSGMTVYRPTAEHVRLMSKLAGTGCKRLIYRDMEYVKDIIIKGI